MEDRKLVPFFQSLYTFAGSGLRFLFFSSSKRVAETLKHTELILNGLDGNPKN